MASFWRVPTFLGNLCTFNVHINLCLEERSGAPGGPPGNCAGTLESQVSLLMVWLILTRKVIQGENQCFVTAPRRREPIKISIWVKTPSCSPNGCVLKPLPFPTIPVLPLTWPILPLGRWRQLAAALTQLHYSICTVKICLSFPRDWSAL